MPESEDVKKTLKNLNLEYIFKLDSNLILVLKTGARIPTKETLSRHNEQFTYSLFCDSHMPLTAINCNCRLKGLCHVILGCLGGIFG